MRVVPCPCLSLRSPRRCELGVLPWMALSGEQPLRGAPQTGRSFREFGRVYYTDGTSETWHNASTPPEKVVVEDNRFICESPFDTGDSPTCPTDANGVQVARGTPVDVRRGIRGRVTALNNPTVPYHYDPRDLEEALAFGGGVGNITEATVPPVVYSPHYNQWTQDNSDAGFYNSGKVPCEAIEDTRPDYCAPWSQVYGFFFGDGEFTDLNFLVQEVSPQDKGGSGGVSTTALHLQPIFRATPTTCSLTNMGPTNALRNPTPYAFRPNRTNTG